MVEGVKEVEAAAESGHTLIGADAGVESVETKVMLKFP